MALLNIAEAITNRVAQVKGLPGKSHWRRGLSADDDNPIRGVPDKVQSVEGWKPALRQYMDQDIVISSIVQHYSTKLTQIGGNKHVTLTVLADVMWTMVVTTWEAVIDAKLPGRQAVNEDFKEKFEDLNLQLYKVRKNYLEEIAEHRDIRRQTLGARTLAALGNADSLEDHDIYRFVPEDALDSHTREYFKASVKECVKLVLTRQNAAEDANADTAAQLSQANDEIETLTDRVQELAANFERAQATVDSYRTRNLDERSTQVEVDRAKKDLVVGDQKLAIHKELLEACGFDVNLPEDYIETGSWIEAKTEIIAAKVAAKEQQQHIIEEAVESRTRATLEELEKKEALIQDLSERLEAVEQECAEQSNNLEVLTELQQANEALTAEVKLGNEEVQRLTSEVFEARSIGPDLMRRLEEAERSLAASAEAASGVQGEIASLQEQLLAEQKRRQEAEAATAAMQAQGASEASALRAEADTLRAKVETRPTVDPEAVKAAAKMAKRITDCEQLLQEADETIAGLKQTIVGLRDKARTANLAREAIEQAMEELKKKFNELKKALAATGVSTAVFEKALETAGIEVTLGVFAPIKVYDRLFNDAMDREKKLQAKRDAQREAATLEHVTPPVAATFRRSMTMAVFEKKNIMFDDRETGGWDQGVARPMSANRPTTPDHVPGREQSFVRPTSANTAVSAGWEQGIDSSASAGSEQGIARPMRGAGPAAPDLSSWNTVSDAPGAQPPDVPSIPDNCFDSAAGQVASSNPAPGYSIGPASRQLGPAPSGDKSRQMPSNEHAGGSTSSSVAVSLFPRHSDTDLGVVVGSNIRNATRPEVATQGGALSHQGSLPAIPVNDSAAGSPLRPRSSNILTGSVPWRPSSAVKRPAPLPFGSSTAGGALLPVGSGAVRFIYGDQVEDYAAVDQPDERSSSPSRPSVSRRSPSPEKVNIANATPDRMVPRPQFSLIGLACSQALEERRQSASPSRPDSAEVLSNPQTMPPQRVAASSAAAQETTVSATKSNDGSRDLRLENPRPYAGREIWALVRPSSPTIAKRRSPSPLAIESLYSRPSEPLPLPSPLAAASQDRDKPRKDAKLEPAGVITINGRSESPPPKPRRSLSPGKGTATSSSRDVRTGPPSARRCFDSRLCSSLDLRIDSVEASSLDAPVVGPLHHDASETTGPMIRPRRGRAAPEDYHGTNVEEMHNDATASLSICSMIEMPSVSSTAPVQHPTKAKGASALAEQQPLQPLLGKPQPALGTAWLPQGALVLGPTVVQHPGLPQLPARPDASGTSVLRRCTSAPSGDQRPRPMKTTGRSSVHATNKRGNPKAMYILGTARQCTTSASSET